MPNLSSWHFEDKLVYKCNAGEFIDCCLQAYKDDNHELALKRIEVARSNSWKNRVQKIKEIYYTTNRRDDTLINALC
jgi:hypothetical protein